MKKCARVGVKRQRFANLPSHQLHIFFCHQVDSFLLLQILSVKSQRLFNMDPFEAEIHSVVESFNKVRRVPHDPFFFSFVYTFVFDGGSQKEAIWL